MVSPPSTISARGADRGLHERPGDDLGAVGVRRHARRVAGPARGVREQRRVDRAGMDHRAPHAAALLHLLHLQRVDEPAQRVLGRGVGAPGGQRRARHQRAGRHDHPARLPQVRERRADDVHGSGERDGDRPVEVLRIDLEHVAEDGRSGVGDHDVEPAEHLHRGARPPPRPPRGRRGPRARGRRGAPCRSRCSAARSARRDTSTRSAPSRANSVAAARPTPELAPVMRILRPRRRAVSFESSIRHVRGRAWLRPPVRRNLTGTAGGRRRTVTD